MMLKVVLKLSKLVFDAEKIGKSLSYLINDVIYVQHLEFTCLGSPLRHQIKPGVVWQGDNKVKQKTSYLKEPILLSGRMTDPDQ